MQDIGADTVRPGAAGPGARAIVEAEVRELVRRRGLDPEADRAALRDLVAATVTDYEDRALRGGVPALDDRDGTARSVVDAVGGLGPLQPYLDDPDVEEIWINGPERVFVARRGVAELTPVVLDDVEVRALIERMLKSSGRRVDLSSPFVDASLPGGHRLHAVVPDITRSHAAINIRKFVARARTLEDLAVAGALTAPAAAFLRAAVAAGLNVLVSGATQAGKTTMLGALLAAVPVRERIITCEEVFELEVTAPDHVALQCRQPSLEGHGEIPLRRLVKEALRMRPDRLVIGEVRQAESLDLLIALNSGLPGMCTLHANSAKEAVTKLCTLPLLAGQNIGSGFVVPTVAASIDLVVHCVLGRDGTRRVAEIRAVTGRTEGPVVETAAIFRTGSDGGPDGEGPRLVRAEGYPPHPERFAALGVELGALLGVPGTGPPGACGAAS